MVVVVVVAVHSPFQARLRLQLGPQQLLPVRGQVLGPMESCWLPEQQRQALELEQLPLADQVGVGRRLRPVFRSKEAKGLERRGEELV